MTCSGPRMRAINGTGCRLCNCSSRTCTSSWRGWTGLAVGCGGVAVFDDYAEVKRMYTRPATRGRGVAKALLCRIENEVRGANKSVLRLETGTHQQEAIGLYERMGFRPRGPFGPYAAMPACNIETSLFFEKILP
jgi:putative acetyltransferase